jgi:hypothetical protein
MNVISRWAIVVTLWDRYFGRMARESKKSWLPKSNKGGWSSRDSGDGRFVTQKSASHSTKSVSRTITLPNGSSIKTVRRDVMDKALGRDGSRKR